MGLISTFQNNIHTVLRLYSLRSRISNGQLRRTVIKEKKLGTNFRPGKERRKKWAGGKEI